VKHSLFIFGISELWVRPCATKVAFSSLLRVFGLQLRHKVVPMCRPAISTGKGDRVPPRFGVVRAPGPCSNFPVHARGRFMLAGDRGYPMILVTSPKPPAIKSSGFEVRYRCNRNRVTNSISLKIFCRNLQFATSRLVPIIALECAR